MRTLLYFISRLAIACPLLLLGCGDTGGGGGPATCGNGTVEGTEQCDDGNTDDGDGCDFECFTEGAICGDGVLEGREECEGNEDCYPAGHVNGCQTIPTAFRWDSFGLLDPKVYDPASPCTTFPLPHQILIPILDLAVRGNRPSITEPLSALNGLIDLGFVLTFDELAQGNGESTEAEFLVADCIPLEPPGTRFPTGGPTPCSPTIVNPSARVSFTATTKTEGTCLAALPDTTDFPEATNRTVEAGDHGCFANDEPVDLSVSLGSVVTIPLTGVRLAAQWADTPATRLANGFVYGFLSEAAATDIFLQPPDLLLIGGKSLASVFTPDTSPSSTCDHRDEGPDGEVGWWVYFPFSAEEVPWEGGLTCGDGSLDTNATIGDEQRDEVCDPGIASGAGSCAAPVACVDAPVVLLCLDECDDGIICTEDVALVGDPCTPSCFHRALSDDPRATETDGCCALDEAPAGDNVGGFYITNDPDCVELCGNDAIEPFEVCEVGDATSPCDIPETCDDENACTRDFITKPGALGSPVNPCAACPEGEQFRCLCGHTPVTETDDGTDDCCPEGAGPGDDPDCSA